MRAEVDQAALRAVITYKWVKGAFQLGLGAALALTLLLGLSGALADWAHLFRNHATRAYAVVLGRALERATTPRGLHVTLLALLVDGVVTCVEAWALHRRRPWGTWLVVGVTGSLLPFEAYELVHRFRWVRVLLLGVNAAVVAFLVVHARAQARGFSAAAPPDPAQPPAPGGRPRSGAAAPPDPAQPPAPGGRPRSGAAAPPDPAQPRGSGERS